MSKQAITNNTGHDIEQLLQNYFDGLYFGDTQLLARVFHPEACYSCATGGEWIHLTMPEYFHRVQNRPIPAKQGQQRRDRILALELAGPETAMAKVNCALGGRFFTDFLSLVFTDDRWQIIAKVFHYDPLDCAAETL